jgi:hypothetical protein
VQTLSERPEPLQSGSRALHAINELTVIGPDSETSVFVAAANLMKTLTISYL